MPQVPSHPCRFPGATTANNGILVMYSALSLLIGAGLVYGQIKELEETMGRGDQEGAGPDAEDAWAPFVSLRSSAGREQRPPDTSEAEAANESN